MKKLMIYFLIIVTLIILYSALFESKNIVIKEYPITNNKISTSHHGLKVVHFSDLHFGTTIKIKQLINIVDKINALNPDLVFFTGDLLDSNIEYTDVDIEEFIYEFNKIKPALAAYIIKGNHDYEEIYNKIVDETNFTLLNNSVDYFYLEDQNPIKIIGLGSLLKKDHDLTTLLLPEDELYTILLIHEPDLLKEIKLNNIDLVLAGHSHNGQVRLPYIGAIIKPEGAKQYYDERYLIDNTPIFISSGLGTSKINLRLFNPPSFNFYRLYNH